MAVSKKSVITRNVTSFRRSFSCNTIVTNVEVQDTDCLDTPIFHICTDYISCPLLHGHYVRSAVRFVSASTTSSADGNDDVDDVVLRVGSR